MNSILFSIVFFLISITIIFIFKSIRRRYIKFLSWKLSALIAGLYLGVLIMLVPILNMLPNKDVMETVENTSKAIATSQNLMNDLYTHHLPTEEDLNNLEGIYKNSSQSFKVDSNKLSFNLMTSTGSYHVLIERKDVNDGEINVSTYVTTQYIGEVIFTKRILPPTILLQDGMLSVITPNIQTLHFKQINLDFTVAQFRNKTLSITRLSPHFGDQIIYIRVPKSLAINKGMLEDRIQIIE